MEAFAEFFKGLPCWLQIIGVIIGVIVFFILFVISIANTLSQAKKGVNKLPSKP